MNKKRGSESKKVVKRKLQMDEILQMKAYLEKLVNISPSEYVSFIKAQIQILAKALEQAKNTSRYKIAVAGRFKVGKSAFVNALMGEPLAGVNVNPETAAITTFCYAETAKVEIEFISSEKWQELEKEWANSSKNQEVARPEVARFERFYTFYDNIDTQPNVNLDDLVEKLIHPNKIHTIDLKNWQDESSKKSFISEIKKYTSAKEPIHYLVNRITVYAPIDILRGMELIDTPGLDDPDWFRVHLTEELMQHVDTILFLTSSGASYSQSDKDFIIHQLRYKQIKHLQLILTKSDEAFENAIRDAKANREPQPNFDKFSENEKQRVEREVKRTLEELLNDNEIDDSDGIYFIEQLADIPVHVISIKYREECNPKLKDGGITRIREGVKAHVNDLFNNHLEQAQEILNSSLENVRKELKRYFEDRSIILKKQFNFDKAKDEIITTEQKLEDKIHVFRVELNTSFEQLEEQIRNTTNTFYEYQEIITRETKKVLKEFEKEDIQIHWKIRRSYKWGIAFYQDLQNKVADRIFPKISILLNKLSNHFSNHVETAKKLLVKLEFGTKQQGVEYLSKPELIAEVILARFQKDSQLLVEQERDKIINMLHDFVVGNLREQLEIARNNVASIKGGGTTIAQSKEVEKFYTEIELLLIKALREHLLNRINAFAECIQKQAASIEPTLENSLKNDIKKSSDALDSSQKMIRDMKKQEKIVNFIRDVLRFLEKNGTG